MWISRLQNKAKTCLSEVVSEDNASIAIALLLGDSSYLDDGQKNVFGNASLSHILAISGMHVTYVIVGISVLLKKIDTRKRMLFLLCFLVFFAQITGASPSVCRAVIMTSIMIISKLFYRKSDTINNIAISCFVILVINPYNICEIGFQLSFLGTLGIVLLHPKIKTFIMGVKKMDLTDDTKVVTCKISIKNISEFKKVFLKRIYSSVWNIVAVSVSANIVLIPILAYHYNTISFAFLLSNVLVAPILAIMIYSGYATIMSSFFSLHISKFFSVILNVCIVIFSEISNIVANLSLLRFTCGTPSIMAVLLYYAIVIYVFYFFQRSHVKTLRRLIVISVIIVFSSKLFSLFNPNMYINFIDVGQGDSTLIITSGNKRILIDGGGSENSDYDVGKNVLVPYLLDRKITVIDYMFISHFDSDHCEGLFTVMESLHVKNAVISRQGKVSENYEYFTKEAQRNHINVICVQAGDRLKIDNHTYIDIVWPSESLIQENVLNNNSIVFKLNYNSTSVLFTGDIEAIAEQKIVESYNKNQLKSDILKVAHHGSKSSSTQQFLDAVQPEIALIGVGKDNNFGHPNEGVISRLKNLRYRNI